jgi:hypothetical protein
MGRQMEGDNMIVDEVEEKQAETEPEQSKARRRRRGRKQDHHAGGAAEVEITAANGEKQVFSGHIVDLTEYGVGIETTAPLSVGALVTIESQFFAAETSDPTRRQARVIHCRLGDDGLYRTGFGFEDPNEPGTGKQFPSPAAKGSLPDYYETLQISANADSEMIQRVFRLLAQRYHPDNAESGNDEIFRSILQAYRVLSDPEKRAAYDTQHRAAGAERARIFEQQEPTNYAQEKQLRGAILQTLYEARKKQPGQPTVALKDLEQALRCSRERLDFNLWYLRGKGQVTATDGGGYVITPDGVDAAETYGRQEPHRPSRLLLEERRAASYG